jgi:hypothetical protein
VLQVVLQFPNVFWDDSADYFGAAQEVGSATRGRCCTFWNVHRWAAKPLLIGLFIGAAADQVLLCS